MLKSCNPACSFCAIGMQRHTGFGLQGCLMLITARAVPTGHRSARAWTGAPLPSPPPPPLPSRSPQRRRRRLQRRRRSVSPPQCRSAMATAIVCVAATAAAAIASDGDGGGGESPATVCVAAVEGDGRCRHGHHPVTTAGDRDSGCDGSAWRRSRRRRRNHLHAYGWAGGWTDRTKTTAWRGVERLRKRCRRSRSFHETLLQYCCPARSVRGPSHRGGGVRVGLSAW